MENTPRKTKLYNQLAKDYTPKQADMQICRYIEGLEQRIAAMEASAQVTPEESKPSGRGRRREAVETPAQEAETN